MKYLALVFAVLFLVFAYLQLNDPDPLVWIPAYLLPAYVCVRSFQGFVNVELVSILLLVTTLAGASLWLSMTAWEGFFTEGAGMAMKTMNQEYAREACGLWICSAVYVFILILKKYSN
ncbi:MAG: transmembrane 220 family protein [Flectobacillus sp.]|nr:transmembrane 220 family protein [Flectobacillus sp.]